MWWCNAEDDDDVCIAVAVRLSTVADDDDGIPWWFATEFVAECRAAADATDAFTQCCSDELLLRDRGPADPTLHATNDILRANCLKPVKKFVI